MTRSALLVVSAIALAGPTLVVEHAGGGTRRLVFPGEPLPRSFGSYEFADADHLDADSLELIRPAGYWLWNYASDSEAAFSVYVAEYSGIDLHEAHDPSICYPAQGWEITSSTWIDIPVGDQPLRARELIAVKGRYRERVVYWFQHADRWPRTALVEPFARLWDRFRGRPQYAFIRFSVAEATSTPELLRDIAATLAPNVRAHLESAVPAETR